MQSTIPSAILAAMVLLVGCVEAESAGMTLVRPTPFVDVDKPSGDTDDTDEPVVDTDEPPVSEAGEACYPGAARDWTLCLPVLTPASAGSAYVYPPAYQGNPNYRAPVAYLDLDALDPSTRLAPNFTLGEVAQASKGRWAVVQPHAIAEIQAIRDEVGALGVNSGYRSPGYNAGISGSATYSRHTYGDAFDLAPSTASLTTLRQACEDAGAAFVSVYTSHIHCDWRDDPVDTSFFGATARRSTLGDLPILDAWLHRDGAVWHALAEGWDEGEPLRVWWAYDGDGVLLVHQVADTFLPPPGTARVVVEVGQAIVRTVDIHGP